MWNDCTPPYSGYNVAVRSTMGDVVSLHEMEYDQKPAVVASAPGVMNLMGAHTESTDGYLLLFGLNRRAAVAASLRSDASIRFYICPKEWR